MKKIFFIVSVFVSLFFTVSLVNAIPNPAPIYCTEMGYVADGSDCVFPDGQRCEQWAFYNGTCGQSYKKELACAKSGESLKPGHECCASLIPIQIKVSGTPEGICPMVQGAWLICAPCGNGVCDTVAESICNCPEDCSASSPIISTDNPSDGKAAEVMITPDVALLQAVEKLGDVKNIKIDLEQSKYTISGEREVKILGLFNVKMAVSVEVDAQTGEVSKIQKPWWSFLAW